MRFLAFFGLFLSLFVALFGLALGLRAPQPTPQQAAPSQPARQSGPRILIDSVHAHNALGSAAADEFSYHETYGMRRGFAWLRAAGASVEEMTSGRISAEKLKGVDVLFLNLVSANLPPFYVSEIAALKSWIQNGGNLFVITDHSNAYFHAYRLAPLFEELDLQISTVTASDVAPHTLASGNGWLAVSQFKPHPIVQGVNLLGIQTGGATDARFGVAFTSPQGWGDEWSAGEYGEGSNLGFYGNWKRDADEKIGPLAVVSAKEFGKGRIVVAGDQNMFGDPFFDYNSNGKLWRNAFAWLAREPKLNDETAYRKWRGPTVVAWENSGKFLWGNDSKEGFFNVFGQLGRALPTRASSQIEDAALVLLADDGSAPAGLAAHLKAGKNVVILESDGRGVLFENLEKEFGAPQTSEAGGAREWKWPGIGQVLALPNAPKWRNSTISPPERKPTTAQTARLEVLVELLRAAS